MQQHQLITDEDRETIQSFVTEMRSRANDLPTYEGTDCPRDDSAEGAYLERDLFSGVTLVMDWGYLDAPSTYLVIETDTEGYETPTGKSGFLEDRGGRFEDLSLELSALLDCGRAEYACANSIEGLDMYDLHGVMPW